MSRFVTVVGLVLLVGCLGLAGTAAADEGADITSIDDNHDLADDAAIAEWHDRGYVATDLDQIDATVRIGSRKADVGLDRGDAPWTTDIGNQYLRIEYHEDIDRTIRIWIPADYISPYERDGVDSLKSHHSADLSPVRDREYLEVVVRLDGDDDELVIPLARLAAGVESLIADRAHQIDEATGGHFSSDDDWAYIEPREIDDERIVELDIHPDEGLAQYDATPDAPRDTWINVEAGEQDGVPVYYHRDPENDSMYLVVASTDPPTIRYKADASFRDEYLVGGLNDVRETIRAAPERIAGMIPSPFAIGPAPHGVIR